MRDPLSLLEMDLRPDEEFLLTKDGSFTRGRLMQLAAGIAVRLAPLKVVDECVIVSLDSGSRFVAALVGCWLAGATPVLLDPLVRRELKHAVSLTDARAVIWGRTDSDENLSSLTVIVPDGGRSKPGCAQLRQEEDPLIYLFTSGSTGRPVLVPKNFVQLDVEFHFLKQLLSSPRRVATLVPWCHILGFLTTLLLPARLPGVCDLSAGISPLRVLEKAATGALDLVVAVPAIYRVMLQYLESGRVRPPSRTCRFVTSAAPLDRRLRGLFYERTGCKIVDLYGSTEAGGVAWRDDDGPWRIEPHVEVRITESNFLEVRSPSVSVGRAGTFYRLGDLARFEEGGFVLLGRTDDVVKIGGRRTSLAEVTLALESCPGVNCAQVLAEMINGSMRIVAYVECSDGRYDEEGLKRRVRKQLADHKVPRIIRILDALPKTPAGKVDRQALKSIFFERD